MVAAKHTSHILCLGLNHATSSVSLRERLAFNSHQLQSALARIGCGDDSAWNSIQELVILSTCNRVELYAVSNKPIFDALEVFLSETKNCPRENFSNTMYRLLDGEAIQHLFEVASGLDSLVIGEPQILGQVTDAYSTARKHGTPGKILSRMFEVAIRAGKRARTETNISQNPASIASIAVNLIAKFVPDLPAAKIMVLGAGEMAELAVEALRKRGAQTILVVNRTLQRAQELADRWEGQAAALETLLDHLNDMDIVITSTGAPHIVIRPSMVEEAMKYRFKRPLVIMDIAVPRDVDPDVKNISGVYLHDLDTLSNHLESNIAQREAEVPRVQAILAEERAALEKYLVSLNVIPIIVDMRNQADSIRQDELRKAIRRMPDLTPDMERQIEDLTKSIVSKILHSPTARLKAEANGHNAADYASVARALFGLE
jgi:glutamyl-tRNA reductase